MYHHSSRARKTLEHEFDRIKDIVSGAALGARDRASDLLTNSFDTAKAKSHHLHTSINRYAKRKPLKTIGWALATGLLIGLAVKRNSSNGRRK